MLKEKLENAVNNVANIASVTISCIGATVDTITDEEVLNAWKAKELELRTIRKKHLEQWRAIYAEYNQKMYECDKAAKAAKDLVKAEFTGTVRAVFGYYLNERRTQKQRKLVK